MTTYTEEGCPFKDDCPYYEHNHTKVSMHDRIATELDKRKIQKLIDDGVITQEDIRNAEIIDETDEGGLGWRSNEKL